MKNKTIAGILLAVLAAALYAINAPFSKILLDYLPPTFLAGFLYLGAGAGMAFVLLFRLIRGKARTEKRLTAAELPYTVAMILLDIAAPICLMTGLNGISASGASLLNNFEIVATAVIALAVFKEKIGTRLWFGIGFVTLACVILSIEDITELRISFGAVFVLLAAVLWGFENNCTKKLSGKDPLEIVLLKGVFSGAGACVVAVLTGERIEHPWCVAAAAAVGMIAYGFSIFAYIYAQREIGAARTGAYYAVAPFIGTALSFVIFREQPTVMYFVALAFMAVGAWLSFATR